VLDVYDEDEGFVDSDDDSGGDRNPLLSGIALPAEGCYTFEVSAYSGSGDYEISLEEAASPEMGSLSYGDEVTGELDAGGHHFWTFEGQAGDAVTISMIGQGDLTDTYLELVGPDEEQLTTDDDSGEGSFALISDYVLQESGTYRITARSYSDQSGPYTLTLDQVEITGETIAYGDEASGELTEDTPRQYWFFEGQAGDVVTISMIGEGDLSDTYLELYGPDEMRVATDDDSGGDGSARITDYVLPEDGEYRIAARAYSDQLGPYTLTLEQVDLTGETISYGDTASGELTEDAPQQYWFFEGQEGDVVTISMVGQGDLTDTYLELYGPDGAQLTSDDDSGDDFFALIEEYELPDDGTYRITAKAYGGAVGEYELSIESLR
jgi:hypothetical protein